LPHAACNKLAASILVDRVDRGRNMRITTIALAGLLVLCSTDRKANTENPASEKKVGARTEIAPVAPPDNEGLVIVPTDPRLVTQAGHPIVVLFTGACKPGETSGRIELLAPTPDFVELIPLCRCEGGGVIGALVINPSNKDVGLHTVAGRTNGCDGTPRDFEYEVKVKRP
jgi:hypothetical protein